MNCMARLLKNRSTSSSDCDWIGRSRSAIFFMTLLSTPVALPSTSDIPSDGRHFLFLGGTGVGVEVGVGLVDAGLLGASLAVSGVSPTSLAGVSSC